MSFTTNTSNLSGKSTTNAFDIVANSLTVNKNTLCKGDLTVLGTTHIGNVTLENAYVNYLTVNNFTAINPVPIGSGGTGLATIGTPNQVLTVNSGGTALIYAAPSLTNPSIITGTGFTGNPTLSLGLEADTGSLGRGFIRTGVAAVNGLFLGTASATVLRLWSNFATDSNAEIINTNANFTYNSTGSSGVFQVLSGGGGISFTNSGIGTISMATAAGNLSMAAGAGTISLTTGVGATSITTGAGPISLTTGAGNISLTTAAAGIISLTVSTAGAINIGTALGAVNLYGSLLTLAAPAIYIGTALIPSVLVFACGDVTGVTGFWNITTLAFQLNAVSISLNSTLTIALNNNTTIGGFLSASGNVLANSGNLSSTTALNPSVTVYKSSADHYGMDLGYNATTSRFRTRIFAPVGNDIALSTHTASPTSQSNFTDKLIINSTTGVISLNGQTSVTGTLETINGNIITNQNIVGGVEIINSGNLSLSAASPGNILIKGGSGSTITLPNATTLIVGYIYTINNNTSFPTIVNRFTSGTVGTVPALNAATVICTGTSSANGDWDINITGPTTATDWANPGQIGSGVPNTGVFTTLTASFGNIFTNQNIINGVIILNAGNVIPLSASSPGTILVRGGTGSIIILPDATTLIIGFTYTITNSTNSSVFIKNYFSQDVIGTIPALSAATVTCLDADFLNGFWDIHITGPSTIVNWGTPGQIGSTVPNTGAFTTLSASVMNTSGNVLANSVNTLNTTALNPSVTVYKTSSDLYGMDLGYNATTSRFRTRMFAPVGNDIALSTHTASPTSQSNFTDKLIINSTTGFITLNGDTEVNNGNIFTNQNVLANSGNLSSTTALNPSVTVYKNSTDQYGMDLGFNATTTRFRTRIFAPVGQDIALSTHTASPTSQSNFTDKLIVNSTTGVISINGTTNVTNGNIFTNQNIIGGVEIINSGNLSLSAASPGYILIKGGSGSTITLPNATTLIVGYIYTINNNTSFPTIVNRFTSGTVGTVPALNAATVICTGTSSANGDWDIHITGPTTGTDWASPGQIGSAVPNTGAFTTLSASVMNTSGNVLANSGNLSSTTALNPSVTVYKSSADLYGMDLGYSATTGRFRTRIFAPVGQDIALSTHTASPTSQSDFTDKLIINSTTGVISLNGQTSVTGTLETINGNIITNQNIVGGVQIINNGNLALTVNSPGNILIRGGSGSIITLPDATTLLVGYVYTINNNSSNPAIVNQFTSGTVGTIISGNCAQVTCIANNSANGQWDIHISGASGTTDWGTPGQIGSAVPNTGAFTTLSASNTTITASSSTLSGIFNVVNTNTNPTFTANIFAPSLNLNSSIFLGIGKSNTDGNSALFYYTNSTIPTTSWTIYNSSTSITQIYNGNISMTAPFTNIVGQAAISNNLLVNSGNLSSTTALNPSVTVYKSSADLYGMDLGFNTITSRFRTRIFAPAGNDIALSTHTASPTSQSNFTDRLIVNGTTGNTQITGSLNVTGTITSGNLNSSLNYNASGLTNVSANSWTDLNFMTITTRSIGTGFLSWINQSTGFRNDTGVNVKINVSFSCQRVSNTTGITALRIQFADIGTGVQDVSGADAVSISANGYLAPGEALKCQIYQNNIGNNNVDYQNIFVTVNLQSV